ncbi:GNAT family N-acetyltransferase [Paenibacillus lycopersici]|uniref:GNAT family N-acetyltransferase n=1 Tax=Paenibacillus lycopersici TaxID=2704462 RepID=A0A6C0FZL6_9BACL|nr:GNAT family protein [Paenibacillus lycopersici]QHT60921.1 GNAT family N-acetyltransferase [Paenibacillus lycopersici]
MRNESPVLAGRRITLRPPIEQDVLDYLACGTNAELTRMYGGDTRQLKALTLETATAYIDRIRSQPLNWCIEWEGRCIGEARLTVEAEDRKARYAVGIFDPGCWSKGIGTEATTMVLRYAFARLRLHRVDLKVLEYNRRAIRCYEKCGFVIEGKEREGAFIEDRFETDIIMSILEQEYRAMAANPEE